MDTDGLEFDWWSRCKPLYTEGDGQTEKRIFAMQEDGKWVYAVVTFSDDGIPMHSVELKGGKASEFHYGLD